MSSPWPSYDHEPLEDGRSWSATFESDNQHMDEVYYAVTLHEGGRDLPPFTVVIPMGWVGDGNWEKPDFAPKLGARIAREAAQGKTNTT
jgi:hypothetical protein